MTKYFTTGLAAVVLIIGCTQAPKSSPDQSQVVSVTLTDVSLCDALRMSHRISNIGICFTDDSLSRQDLEKIRVTVDVKDVTLKEYLHRLGIQSGLSIDEVRYCLFRVVRNGGESNANKPPQGSSQKLAP